jgi:hypothetical protein
MNVVHSTVLKDFNTTGQDCSRVPGINVFGMRNMAMFHFPVSKIGVHEKQLSMCLNLDLWVMLVFNPSVPPTCLGLTDFVAIAFVELK